MAFYVDGYHRYQMSNISLLYLPKTIQILKRQFKSLKGRRREEKIYDKTIYSMFSSFLRQHT